MQTSSSVKFPPAWPWFVDELIPGWVKDRYSPKESWKGKPFSKEDARFFFKGIEELSELFTDDRPRDLPTYFQHPKYRSSYLLYFLPLQAAKFVTLFQLHPEALHRALEAAAKNGGVLRIADLGAGPGTASLGLLLSLMDPKLGVAMPAKIEMDWVDTNRSIMEDGKALAETLASHFPKLRDKVTIRLHSAPWWEIRQAMPASHAPDLVLMGNVQNEARMAADHPKTLSALVQLVENVGAGGVLMIEPAFKTASQHLSQVRDLLLQTELLPKDGRAVWGPCLHAGACPLSSGRDWCHFSVPAQVPGQWFKGFSEGLGGERQWLKFSYLWLASPKSLAKQYAPHLRRVVSDPLAERGHSRHEGAKSTSLLLCEPEHLNRIPLPRGIPPQRGDLFDLRAKAASGVRAPIVPKKKPAPAKSSVPGRKKRR